MTKPWRRQRNGRHFGAFYATLNGKTVNLQTQDATEALKRIRLAKAGKWSPSSSTSRRQTHAEAMQEQQEAERLAADAVDLALASPPQPLPSPSSVTSPDSSLSSRSASPSSSEAPAPLAGDSSPSPSPSPPTSAAPAPGAPPSPPASADGWNTDAAAAAGAAAADLPGGATAGAGPDASAAAPGVDGSDLLKIAGAAVCEGVKLGVKYMLLQRRFMVDPPTSDKARMLIEVGDKITAESVEQGIVRLFPLMANIHPLWGVPIGVLCVVAGQLVCMRRMTPAEVRAEKDADELAERREVA